MNIKKNTGVYDNSIVIDGLNVSNWDSPEVYRSLKSGGVTAINATIAVWEGFHETMRNLEDWYVRFQENNDLMHATSVADIIKAKSDNKTAIIFGWQNASPIENRLDRLQLFHALGVRIVQITYNERNLIGNGCYERRDEGLSLFGVDAVKEMNNLGILIDLSHVGDKSTLEAAELSEGPVAITHANARSYVNHPRNKTDDALRLVRDKGGVIGANAFPPFLKNGLKSTLVDYIDCIEDLIERVGIDHTAIGTDFTQNQSPDFYEWIFMQQGTKSVGKNPMPDSYQALSGLESPDKMRNISTELEKRGYTREDIVKIIGGNWLKLFEKVWK